MRIAFIGYGNVGAPLADHLQRAGHDVVLAAADPASEGVTRARARNPGLRVEAPAAAVAGADVVFLATPFRAQAQVAETLGPALAGKVLVDCTNPVGAGLRHGLGSVQSGAEHLQDLLPSTRVVKAFSVYGFENFENSAYPGYGVGPMMPICGNDAGAKTAVASLAEALGWEPLDVGVLDQALHLEHMTLLWVRMVRAGGASPHLVWAALRR